MKFEILGELPVDTAAIIPPPPAPPRLVPDGPHPGTPEDGEEREPPGNQQEFPGNPELLETRPYVHGDPTSRSTPVTTGTGKPLARYQGRKGKRGHPPRGVRAQQLDAAAEPILEKTGKGRRAYTPTMYQEILAAFRACAIEGTRSAATGAILPNFTVVAEMTGRSRPCVKKAWFQGWSFAWARPIRIVLDEETAAARLAGLERAKATRELRAADAEKKRLAWLAALEEEGALCSAVREDLLGAALIARRLLATMSAMANVVEAAVLDPVTKQPLPTPRVDAIGAMRILRAYNLNLVGISTAHKVVIDLSQIRMPKDLEQPGETSMTDEELAQNLQLVSDVYAEIEGKLAQEKAGGRVQ